MLNTISDISALYANNINAAPKSSALTKSKDLAKAEKAAEDFEAFFMTKMMESMFEGVSTDGIFGGGHAEKIYRSMLFNEYGKEMAKVGSIGVKQNILDAIIKMQEMETNGYIQG